MSLQNKSIYVSYMYQLIYLSVYLSIYVCLFYLKYFLSKYVESGERQCLAIQDILSKVNHCHVFCAEVGNHNILQWKYDIQWYGLVANTLHCAYPLLGTYIAEVTCVLIIIQ